MNKCVGPLSECVNALQEILENLIRIQEDIVCGQQRQSTMCTNTNAQNDSSQGSGIGGGGGSQASGGGAGGVGGTQSIVQSSGRNSASQGNGNSNQCNARSVSPNSQSNGSNSMSQRNSGANAVSNKSSSRNKECPITPIDGTPEDGTDCNEYVNDPNCPDTPWYCLPPAKSQMEYDDCLCPDGSSQTSEECEENENENESMSNYNDSLQGEDCCDKLNVQRTPDGYQRIIAVRENCDGSVSKIYALRKNIKPPTNRKVDDCLTELPAAESTRTVPDSGSLVNPEDISDKSSLQSFRYRNKQGLSKKESRKMCDCQTNRNAKGWAPTQKCPQILPPTNSGKTLNSTPQTLINSVHTDVCGKNPFEELQLIIEKERKRLDSVCHSGDKLLSSIEKDRKCNFEKAITEKSNKRNTDERERKSNCSCDYENERKSYSCDQNVNENALQKLGSRIPNQLSEEEATTLLDQMINTTIKGLDKIAKSLKCNSQESPPKPSKGTSSLNSSEIEQLKKHQEVTEQKISCLRMSVHEMLVNMSEVLSTKIDVPEIQEMANDLNIFKYRSDILLQHKIIDKF